MTDLELPSSFRREIVAPVLKTAEAGESCCLIGVGSTGKSNVARHLCRRDVLTLHLNGRSQRVLSVFVDCLTLGDCSLTSMLRLMLRSLKRAVTTLDDKRAATLTAAIAAHAWLAQDGSSEDALRDALHGAITAVLAAGIDRVLFVFDDVDEFVRSAKPPTLFALRSLRNDFKPKLAYVLLMRRELNQLRPQTAEYHEFYELVTLTTLPIGPNSLDDALFMIDRLSARWNPARGLSSAERERTLALSGCHPGILKAILWVRLNDASMDLTAPQIHATLTAHKDIRPECDNILQSLDERELEELRAIAEHGKPLGAALRQVEKKGLVQTGLDDLPRLFSPVLRDYVLRLPAGMHGGPTSTYTVTINGHKVTLPDVEFHLFEVLHQKAGRHISRQELRDCMLRTEHETEHANGTADQRLSLHMSYLMNTFNTPERMLIVELRDGGFSLREA